MPYSPFLPVSNWKDPQSPPGPSRAAIALPQVVAFHDVRGDDADMSDSDPGPHDRAAASGTMRATVPEAARALGISERSVRKRLVAGTLDGIKEGKSWVVLLPATSDAALTDPDADPRVDPADPAGSADPVAAQRYGPHAALEVAAVEVLERLFRDERQRADENRDAALHWQARALRAEEKLAALEAGPIAGPTSQESPNASQDAQDGPGRGDPPQMAADTSKGTHDVPTPASEGLWRKLWRAIIGG